MLYLIDANVLMDANRDYYPMDSVPEFWEWLIHKGEAGEVKIPIEVYEELKKGNDGLAKWVKVDQTKNALLLDEAVDISLVRQVLKEGYADNLTDDEVQKLGRDPFFISYGLKNTKGRCIVTTEVSKPGRERANRHVPNVCDTFEIPWLHAFTFSKRLGFKTNWRDSV